jgi:acyltransferase
MKKKEIISKAKSPDTAKKRKKAEEKLRNAPNENINAGNVTQRISWVDNAKALGIIAVFYGHIVQKIVWTTSIPAAGLQYKLIYSFHMPLFFLLSGFLMKETQHRKLFIFMKNKFMTRVVPFFFFNILILPSYFIRTKMSNQSIDVSQIFQRSLLLPAGIMPFNPITWFLACLFSVEVINYLLYPVLHKSRTVLCMAMVLFYIMGWGLSYKADIINQYIIIPDYWFIHEALVAYSFYLFGSLIAACPILYKKIDPSLNVFLLLLTATCVFTTFNMNDGPFKIYPVVFFVLGTYGNFLLFPLTAIAGSLCIVSTSRLMPPFSFMSFLGRNTLSLMGLNGILDLFVNIFFINFSLKIFSDNYNHFSIFMQCASLSCITLLLCVPFVIFLKKYLPFMIGYRKDKDN